MEMFLSIIFFFTILVLKKHFGEIKVRLGFFPSVDSYPEFIIIHYYILNYLSNSKEGKLFMENFTAIQI